jgi:GNAT superfamily N-acetyltransferase
MVGHVAVDDAARQLGVAPSRVRALIASGLLRADKVGGRWLVDWDSVLARERAQNAPGRPLTALNAWALLLLASDEEIPRRVDSNTRWRLRQTLSRRRLADLESRLDQRAGVHRLWALPGELRSLRMGGDIVVTGSSAAGELNLDLLAPDTVDAYVPASTLNALVRDHGLEPVAASEANVTLRVVPDDAWMLGGRRTAPSAAVALDLAAYPDSRSARVGSELLERLDAAREGQP